MRFHTSLPVTNIRDTVDFYRVLFDTEPVKTKPDYAKFLPPGLSLNISFVESPESKAGHPRPHLGIEMPDRKSLDRLHARLQEAGLIAIDRETSICCYANQDKFWIADPNGYRWEIYLLLEDTSQKISPQTSCCPTACGSVVAKTG